MCGVESREKAGAGQDRAGQAGAGQENGRTRESAEALVLLLPWLSMWLLGGRQKSKNSKIG